MNIFKYFWKKLKYTKYKQGFPSERTNRGEEGRGRGSCGVMTSAWSTRWHSTLCSTKMAASGTCRQFESSGQSQAAFYGTYSRVYIYIFKLVALRAIHLVEDTVGLRRGIFEVCPSGPGAELLFLLWF